MTNQEERELHRISGSLARIEKKFSLSAKEKRALRTAGIALSLVFINNLKAKLDDHSKFLEDLDRQVERRKNTHLAK